MVWPENRGARARILSHKRRQIDIFLPHKFFRLHDGSCDYYQEGFSEAFKIKNQKNEGVVSAFYPMLLT